MEMADNAKRLNMTSLSSGHSHTANQLRSAAARAIIRHARLVVSSIR
jgi:hypothetical protein